MRREVEIIYHDNYLIVVNKPAGLVTQGARQSKESLLELLKDYIKKRENKPGKVFLAVVHRLDKPVSGVCVLARRSKCANKLFNLIREGKWRKLYLAKVEGLMEGPSYGLWEDYLKIDGSAKGVKILSQPSAEAKRAFTLYEILKREKEETLLLLSPLTGRKHQLRVALSSRGYPIVGDRLYGSKRSLLGGRAILLHALYLDFPHPYSQELMELWAKVPPYYGVNTLDKGSILEFLSKINTMKERIKDVPG
ncbi:MAG: RluA family pseudouridine synthase [Caldimicrobium sp.]|nr:RluA family pseudouridine synthase [Caldimicrobium sp.]